MALSREQAFATIASDDSRPLLVMRECDSCKGSDDALLSERVPRIKAKPRKLDPWLRLHLYAMRLEQKRSLGR